MLRADLADLTAFVAVADDLSFRARASGYGIGYSLAVVILSFSGIYALGLGHVMPYVFAPIVLVVVAAFLTLLGRSREERKCICPISASDPLCRRHPARLPARCERSRAGVAAGGSSPARTGDVGHGAEHHGCMVSCKTQRGWMIAAGLWQDRRHRLPSPHQPRRRRDCLAELVQIDGSEHAWFEDRGPPCTLLGYVDDATSRLQQLRFCRLGIGV